MRLFIATPLKKAFKVSQARPALIISKTPVWSMNRPGALFRSDWGPAPGPTGPSLDEALHQHRKELEKQSEGSTNRIIDRVGRQIHKEVEQGPKVTKENQQARKQFYQKQHEDAVKRNAPVYPASKHDILTSVDLGADIPHTKQPSSETEQSLKMLKEMKDKTKAKTPQPEVSETQAALATLKEMKPKIPKIKPSGGGEGENKSLEKAITSRSMPESFRAKRLAAYDIYQSALRGMTRGNSQLTPEGQIGLLQGEFLNVDGFINPHTQNVSKACGGCGRIYLAKSFHDECPSCSINKSMHCEKCGDMLVKNKSGYKSCPSCN